MTESSAATRGGDDCPAVNAELLANTSLFRNVDVDFLIDRVEKCDRRVIEAGATLIEEGQENRILYIVLSGRLTARLKVQDGVDVSTDLGFGDCVGEMSVIDGRPATASVVAKQRSWLLEIPQELIWTLIDRTTFVSRNLLYILAGRLRHGNLTISASREELHRLHQVVHKDSLTGLRNRRWFDEHLELAIDQEDRTDEPLSLVLLDIDHFKQFNDRFGHPAGDKVLQAVAGALERAVGEDGMAARSGGEEFAVLLADTGRDEAAAIAERVRQAVQAMAPVIDEGRTLPTVTVSLGVAELLDDETTAAFVSRADRALYEAKDRGRNAVVTAAASD